MWRSSSDCWINSGSIFNLSQIPEAEIGHNVPGIGEQYYPEMESASGRVAYPQV